MSTQQSDNNLQCTCDPNAIWAVKGFLGHPSCQSCKKKKTKKTRTSGSMGDPDSNKKGE